MAPKKKLNKAEENEQNVGSQTVSNDSDIIAVENWENQIKSNGREDPVIHLNGYNDRDEKHPPGSDKTEDDPLVKAVGDALDRVALSRSKEDDVDNMKSLLDRVVYVQYQSELQMPDIMRLIQKDLSEPYSIYTYRYFIHNWPMLCFLAMYGEKCVGAIVCKLDLHKKIVRRGYIAMLAVDENYRKEKIGSNLVMRAIAAMVKDGADEVVLETEITNEPALKLYENLGFVRDKRLFRYYLNGVDALRLKLWLR